MRRVEETCRTLMSRGILRRYVFSDREQTAAGRLQQVDGVTVRPLLGMRSRSAVCSCIEPPDAW